MIKLFNPTFNKEMEEAAIHALQNERFVLGESTFKFEEAFARYCGTKHAISTSSGTAALQLTIIASGCERKEVITCPNSFIATSNAILHARADPVFVDADYETNNIDTTQIGEKITKNTKAIVPIHLYGTPADMDAINDTIDKNAKKNNIVVIEDACQAHGATYKEKKAGNLGHAGCFSFYSTKNMTVCGDGGMVTTNDEKLADKIAKMRNCGRVSQFVHEEEGFTYRLNTVNAAIGLVQLKYLDAWNEKRNSVAKKYSDSFRNIDGIKIPVVPSHSKSAFHLYACKTPRRDELVKHLKEKGIETGLHYPIPIHLQPLYVRRFGYKEHSFGVSERIAKEIVCLPVHQELKQKEISYVIETIKEFFR